MPNPTKPTTNLTREELLAALRGGAINFDDEASKLIDTYTQAKEREARVSEREGMQFFDESGEETFKPYLQYRFTGGGLKLSWEDRTSELAALKTKQEVAN